MSTLSSRTGDGPVRRRILLVEDNDAASQGLARLLEAWGFDVTVKHDGTSALLWLEAGPPPDFVLTDLLLPDLDGRDIARHAHNLTPTPRVALITGWDIDSSPDEYHACGIDWIFTKPVDAKRLIARLKQAAPLQAPADGSGVQEPGGNQ
jgi:DNA-binding response OmpR family regulator